VVEDVVNVELVVSVELVVRVALDVVSARVDVLCAGGVVRVVEVITAVP
jgi:hypothetical protein